MKIYTVSGDIENYAELEMMYVGSDSEYSQLSDFIENGTLKLNDLTHLKIQKYTGGSGGYGLKNERALGQTVNIIGKSFALDCNLENSIYYIALNNNYKTTEIFVNDKTFINRYKLFYIPKLTNIFNLKSDNINYKFNEALLLKSGLEFFRLDEKPNTLLLHSSSPVHSSLFWHIQKEKYTGMKLHEIYRTKGEPDYDIEATLKAWEQNPNLIDPIYVKQSFMEKWF